MDDLEKIKKLVKDPVYVCKNCGRAAKDEESLCNPTKL
jgi:rubrerythrin